MRALHLPFKNSNDTPSHKFRWIVLISAAIAAVVWRPRTVLSGIQQRIGDTFNGRFGNRNGGLASQDSTASGSSATATLERPDTPETGATIPAGEDKSGTYRPTRVEPDAFGVVVTDDTPAGLEQVTGWIKGDGTDICPDDYPVKGNGSSRIYHLPGEPNYAQTIASLCFADEDSAAAAGFRARAK